MSIILALLMLKLQASWGWVVVTGTGILIPGEEPVPIAQEAGIRVAG